MKQEPSASIVCDDILKNPRLCMYGGSETTDLYLKHLILEDFYIEEMLKLQLQTYVTSIQGN